MDKRAEVLLKKGNAIGSGEVVTLSDILTFPLSFWLLSIVCLAYYVAIFPFISLGQGIVQLPLLRFKYVCGNSCHFAYESRMDFS